MFEGFTSELPVPAQASDESDGPVSDARLVCDCLALWEPAVNKELSEKHGRLRRLATVFSCIPASSVPSERTFRRCSDVLTKKKNRMLPELLNWLVVLAMNRDLAIELLLQQWAVKFPSRALSEP